MSLDGKRVRIVRDRDPFMYDSSCLGMADGTVGIAYLTVRKWDGRWDTYDVDGWTVAEPLLAAILGNKEIDRSDARWSDFVDLIAKLKCSGVDEFFQRVGGLARD